MGANLLRAAIERGHEPIGYDRDPQLTDSLGREGADTAASLEELAGRLSPPRTVLLYVPHGDPTERVCQALLALLAPGDVVVDGGNSHWEDSRRRHGLFADRRIHFLDVGTSGGLWGARHGACFMAGGEPDAYALVEPLLTDLAFDEHATILAGGPGCGHFVKLVHNAIEFGMVQSIAEGTEMLVRSEFAVDLPALLDNWAHGSVIRSWLIELLRDELTQIGPLERLSTYVEDTGEVKWVLDWALEQDIPSPVIAGSQQALMSYRDVEWPAAKAVALIRHGFGGHPIHTRDEQLAARS
jgi:6-phosphogluconate dehydrogenase